MNRHQTKDDVKVLSLSSLTQNKTKKLWEHQSCTAHNHDVLQSCPCTWHNPSSIPLAGSGAASRDICRTVPASAHHKILFPRQSEQPTVGKGSHCPAASKLK